MGSGADGLGAGRLGVRSEEEMVFSGGLRVLRSTL